MGLNKQALKILLNDNNFKSISGKYLSIGRHTVNIEQDTLFKIFSQFGLPTSRLQSLYDNQQFEKLTRHSNNTLLDSDLIACFSEAEYFCLDRSDYEGASVIQDMNVPIPQSLHNKFDFIYNGSCMDNCFDPVSFIRNTSDMLKPEGRILHIECAGSVPGAFMMFSPEWFFSYYAINEFSDCKVYITIAKEEGKSNFEFETELYAWQPYFTLNKSYNIVDACKSINGLMHVIVIAQKKSTSSSNKNPVQMQYLDNEVIDWRKRYFEFQKTQRPLLASLSTQKLDYLPFNSDHYNHLDSNF